ncbi:type I-E CRISPR-associated protein Cas5/CasD [Donghicola tyrosinivorans]|uniref:CRISPR system Cascade subunit CasD n=1 Tax=Donghicola tyrosinivorans TaxID=1652492 RepID=A0A2T0WD78_9RHOB|nr:type I-E CRISPR-associated protein Cas5/CasD [Donghicola tyrosinivorans]PRY84606.1 CRISPR system Cascade subunit CasD [Donghicola tyrosinivorans]
MTDYLVFTLSATIGAMGDLAGHERRGTQLWPGRSAVTGLLGAALGVRRDGDFSGLDRLGMAVTAFASDTENHEADFRDYHTVETVPSAKAKKPNSRPEALRTAGRETNTTITLRDYRTGPLFGVAVWGSDLEKLEKALLTPVFTLYFGRKSCPLSAPVCPRIVVAQTPEEALAMVQIPYWRGKCTARRLIADAEDGDAHIETRHDRPLDRNLWHFGSRSVAFRTVEIRAGGE